MNQAAFEPAGFEQAAFEQSVFDTGAYVYPWDVLDDPAAPELLAGLGIGQVTLAAFYHATRTLTPRHPDHRVVVAEHSAAYMPLDESRWSGAALRPPAQTWLNQSDAFGAAAQALAAAELPAHAWVVFNHVDPRPGTNYGPAVVNAYGDVYSWALCPARDEVRDYAVRLAGQIAARDDVAGAEFEACGWYGFDHLHAHDKVAGVPLDQAEQFLFSLCFCIACDAEYRRAGIDPAELRTVVRTALDATFRGERPEPSAASERSRIDALLGPQLAAAVLGMRGAVADRLRADVVGAVREQRPKSEFPVLFHANPHAHRSTAFTGLDPASVPDGADGVVVNCWGDPDAATETVALTANAAREGLRVVCGMLVVGGMGSTAQRAGQVLDAARTAGASGIRLYHAGLAGAPDLDIIRGLTRSSSYVRHSGTVSSS